MVYLLDSSETAPLYQLVGLVFFLTLIHRTQKEKTGQISNL